MSKSKVVFGEIYGRWTVTADLGTKMDNGTYRTLVQVRCECGEVKEQFYSVLKKGLSKSCGCLRKEVCRDMRLNSEHKHDLSNHPIYQIWRGMKDRCLNPNSASYKRYGGRGITVCAEWIDDFLSFYSWALNNGWAKGLINDRRDNDKGYSPLNCRFVTPPVSARNTRRNNYIEFNGKRLVITDWATELGISTNSLKKRIYKLKWPLEKALTTEKYGN